MTSAHGERGSSMVETAITLAAALLLLFGIIEFGRAVYTYHLVDNVARAGARWAMVRGSACPSSTSPARTDCPVTSAQVQTYVQSISPMTNQNNVAVSATWPDNTGCQTSGKNGPGCLVVVNVSYPFHFALPFVSTATIPLSSTSQMIISQ